MSLLSDEKKDFSFTKVLAYVGTVGLILVCFIAILMAI